MNIGNKNLSKLLVVMFIACTGMFLFFPYLALYVTEIVGLDEVSTGKLIGMSVVTGQALALAVSIRFKPKRLKERKLFFLSLVAILCSIGGLLIVPFTLFGASVLMVFSLTMIYRFSIALYATSSRALCLALTDGENTRPTLNRVKLVNSVASGVGPLIGQGILSNHSYGVLFSTSFILFLLSLILFLTVKRGESTSASANKIVYGNNPLKEKWFVVASISGFFHYLFEAQIYTYFQYHGHKLLENPTSLIFFTNSVVLVIVGLSMTKVQFDSMSSINMSIVGTIFSATACIIIPFNDTVGLLIFSVILLSLGEYLSPQSRLEYISEGGGNRFARISYHSFMANTLGLSAGFALGGYVFGMASQVLQLLVWVAIALTSILILLMSSRLRAAS